MLDELQDQGIWCQAFADDIVLVFSGETALEIEQRANGSLTGVYEWGLTNKLRFAAHKKNLYMTTRKYT